MSEFKKEKRYVVLKLSKLTDHQKTALGAALAEINISAEAMPECVVVEHDWPNYAETWQSIQAIVEGSYVSRDALAAQVEELAKDRDDWKNAMARAVSVLLLHKAPTKTIDVDKALAEIRAEAGRAGFIAGCKHTDKPNRGMWSTNDLIEHANQYAESIRKGGVNEHHNHGQSAPDSLDKENTNSSIS
jgi:hypothetical protein